jgi:peptidylprolyl isomerase
MVERPEQSPDEWYSPGMSGEEYRGEGFPTSAAPGASLVPPGPMWGQPPPSGAPPPQKRPAVMLLAVLILLFVIVLGGGGVAVYALSRASPTAAPAQPTTMPPTTTAAATATPPVLGPATPPAVTGTTITTADGLQYIDIVRGTGQVAQAGEALNVQYTGWLASTRQKFGSSYDDGSGPFQFTLGVGEVIKGWDEGVACMRVGGKHRLVIPPALADGAQGNPTGHIPPNATLIFDVELISMQG